MVSPKMYKEQLDELGIEGLEIDVSNMENAMQTINDLDDLESVLQKMRHNIRTDIRHIRRNYVEMAKELSVSHSGKTLSRKETEKLVKKKKALVKQRNTKISAYELVENLVDNYIMQIEDARLYIRKSIERRVG